MGDIERRDLAVNVSNRSVCVFFAS